MIRFGEVTGVIDGKSPNVTGLSALYLYCFVSSQSFKLMRYPLQLPGVLSTYIIPITNIFTA